MNITYITDETERDKRRECLAENLVSEMRQTTSLTYTAEVRKRVAVNQATMLIDKSIDKSIDIEDL